MICLGNTVHVVANTIGAGINAIGQSGVVREIDAWTEFPRTFYGLSINGSSELLYFRDDEVSLVTNPELWV